VSSQPFVSYAQNAEDVVLRRALRSVASGHYLEIGANDPTLDSITRSFYDSGWSGITVEPMAELAAAHRSTRPRDVQVEAVAGRPGIERAVLHEVDGTGLSTLDDELRDRHVHDGFSTHDVDVPSFTVDQILERSHHGDLHFVVIDTEGSERDVLSGFDLRRWRPWILVVEATIPNSNEPSHGSWEPGVLAAGYHFCLFDGLSRFYVADERADELATLLSYPANVLDNYIDHRELARRQRMEALIDEDLARRQRMEALIDDVIRWRSAALTRWAGAVARPPAPAPEGARAAALAAELAAIRRTVSWRITRPLRLARRVLPR
jgi:FkbM family methyltransferase